MSIKKQNIAIIGAGISGLALANMLHGLADVEVFEKSRGYGGRLATHYEGDFEFDHGAQFFTAKSNKFQAFLQPLIDAGVVGIWNTRFVEIDDGRILHRRNWDTEYPHYVGIPRMNAIGKYLAKDISIRLCTEVSRIVQFGDHKWELFDTYGNDLGSFDWVVCSAPAYQTQNLLPALFAYHSELQSIQMLGCYAMMLSLPKELDVDWDVALVKHAPISWISFNASKPGRNTSNAVVALSSNKWAVEHLKTSLAEVQEKLLDAFWRIVDVGDIALLNCQIRRWGYANVGKNNRFKCLLDQHHKLAAIGDWCIQGRVENAFTSAYELCNQIIGMM